MFRKMFIVADLVSLKASFPIYDLKTTDCYGDPGKTSSKPLWPRDMRNCNLRKFTKNNKNLA